MQANPESIFSILKGDKRTFTYQMYEGLLHNTILKKSSQDPHMTTDTDHLS